MCRAYSARRFLFLYPALALRSSGRAGWASLWRAAGARNYATLKATLCRARGRGTQRFRQPTRALSLRVRSDFRRGRLILPELEFEEFAEALGLLAGDGDFGLLFVVHFDHEAGFEPGDDLLYVVDVDEVGAVGTPEGIGVQGGVEFFEGAIVGGAFDFLRHYGD